MATFIMLSKVTDEGRATIYKHPERITQVNQDVEKLGAKVVQQYATLGPYDFVNIVEAPDLQTIARISLTLSSRGTVEFLTMPTLSVEELVGGVQQAHDVEQQQQT
jgi:uncharacterized protein with GYD domain